MSKILYVEIAFSEDTTRKLLEYTTSILEKNNIPIDYPIKKSTESHITLCYYSDFSDKETFKNFVESNYTENTEVKVKINHIAIDKHCVAICVSIDDSVKYFPEDKNLHITMMLNGKKPVYSNELIMKTEKDKLLKCDMDISGKIHIVKI